MVFVSDRPGGYGGYDIYYSRYSYEWYEPVNIQYYMDGFSKDYESEANEGFIEGSSSFINTQSDEFRPSINVQRNTEPFSLLFSSNRAGGKGGYDLYFANLPKKISDYSSVANLNRELMEQKKLSK